MCVCLCIDTYIFMLSGQATSGEILDSFNWLRMLGVNKEEKAD